MSNYAYVAVDPHGAETRGTLDVTDQAEALRRIKEMGLFPTRLLQAEGRRYDATQRRAATPARHSFELFGRRVKSSHLVTFTRQLATLMNAGMPLLRGLRILEQQEEHHGLRRIIGELGRQIEDGNSLGEALTQHPKVFNRLYVNMVKAGEIGGMLEIALARLAEFMEKARRIKGKVKAAMVYPCTVLFVAIGILVLLMAFLVPRFQEVFQGMPLPTFTRFIFGLSNALVHNLPVIGIGAVMMGVTFALALRTASGRLAFDKIKLEMPVLGPLFRKVSISRFSRTLGTLLGNGVPILQALTIVKETAGNLVVGRLVGRLHDNVKQGEPLAPTLKASSVFPAMVAGMVDVGEQTGALPDMLLKIADNYDEEVDNAASALTSILEPIMIVFLAVVVGSIVIAMFMPIIWLYSGGGMPSGGTRGLED